MQPFITYTPRNETFPRRMYQHPNTLEVFRPFLAANDFDLVIEIGTAEGGLSAFLYEHTRRFITYDIKPVSFADPVDMRVGSVFHEPHRSEIINLCRQQRTLVLCDGGDKASEVNTFFDYAAVIMAHDYAPSREWHRQQKRWDWCEITDDMIGRRAELKGAWYKNFLEVGWLQLQPNQR